MAKRKYVDDAYIAKVEHALYNDLPLEDYLYEDEFTVDKEVVKELLKPGEEYIVLPDDYSHCILTSYARLINMHSMNQLSVKFTPGSFLCYIFSKRIPTKELFEDAGWEYNIEKFKGYYKKYNWKYIKYP